MQTVSVALVISDEEVVIRFAMGKVSAQLVKRLDWVTVCSSKRELSSRSMNAGQQIYLTMGALSFTADEMKPCRLSRGLPLVRPMITMDA